MDIKPIQIGIMIIIRNYNKYSKSHDRNTSMAQGGRSFEPLIVSPLLSFRCSVLQDTIMAVSSVHIDSPFVKAKNTLTP